MKELDEFDVTITLEGYDEYECEWEARCSDPVLIGTGSTPDKALESLHQHHALNSLEANRSQPECEWAPLSSETDQETRNTLRDLFDAKLNEIDPQRPNRLAERARFYDLILATIPHSWEKSKAPTFKWEDEVYNGGAKDFLTKSD